MLIFGGLSLKKLTDARAKDTLKVVVKGSPTRTHLLQEPYADLYTEGKDGEEPCGESCSKDHAHSHSAPVGQDSQSFYYHHGLYTHLEMLHAI